MPSDDSQNLDLSQVQQHLEKVAAQLDEEIDPSILIDPDARLGEYQIQRLLNFGGQAYVFGAFDTKLQRNVVIKLYRQPIEESDRSRALEEARCPARVDSPHVAKCYDYQVYNERPFLVLEPVCVMSLSQYAATHDLSVARSVEIATQVASGISDVHENGVLHLDLKPDNIVIQNDDAVKIVNLGLSRSITQLSRPDTAGSPAFMPPEVSSQSHQLVGPRTDVFGVTAILYFLLTGQAPFDADTKPQVLERSAAGEFTSASSINPAVPDRLNRVIDKGMDGNVSNRFATAHELKRQLENASTRRRRAVFLMAGMSIVLLLGLFAVRFPWPGGNQTGIRHPSPTAPVDSGLANGIDRVAAGPFADLNRAGKTQLSRDFSLELTSARIETDRGWIDVLPIHGVYLFPLGQQVELTFQSTLPCYPTAFCFNSRYGKPKLQEIRQFCPDAGETGLLNASEALTQVFNPTESAKGVTEYIYIRALDARWVVTGVTSSVEATKFRQSMRGLQPVQRARPFKEAELLVPFRIVKPDSMFRSDK